MDLCDPSGDPLGYHLGNSLGDQLSIVREIEKPSFGDIV